MFARDRSVRSSSPDVGYGLSHATERAIAYDQRGPVAVAALCERRRIALQRGLQPSGSR